MLNDKMTDVHGECQDYLAAPSTTDLAYCIILEHTLAERDRR